AIASNQTSRSTLDGRVGVIGILPGPAPFRSASNPTVLIGMKLFHPPYNSDVFSAVESRKEFDAYEDIVVGKDPESTRHRCLAGRELARIRRTNPSPNIIGLAANR